jgi:hypothetical protein
LVAMVIRPHEMHHITPYWCMAKGKPRRPWRDPTRQRQGFRRPGSGGRPPMIRLSEELAKSLAARTANRAQETGRS